MLCNESAKTIRKNTRVLLSCMLRYKYEPDHKDKELYKDIAWSAYLNIADEFDNYDIIDRITAELKHAISLYQSI